MIDDQLAAFIEGPVMIVLATADDRSNATIARAVGVRHEGEDRLSLWLSRRQWPVLAASLTPGRRLAVTFCRPADYLTYQVKGEILEVDQPSDEDHRAIGRYARDMTAGLHALGVEQPLIDQWIHPEDLVRFRMRASSLFHQTPGPQAGLRVGVAS